MYIYTCVHIYIYVCVFKSIFYCVSHVRIHTYTQVLKGVERGVRWQNVSWLRPVRESKLCVKGGGGWKRSLYSMMRTSSMMMCDSVCQQTVCVWMCVFVCVFCNNAVMCR
jgi:hypothetical protein